MPPFEWVCTDVQVPRRRALYWDLEISLPFELSCLLDWIIAVHSTEVGSFPWIFLRPDIY